jgi:hypothetical protein
MKNRLIRVVPVLALFLALIPSVSAETVLICHAQSVPVTLNASFHSRLSTSLVDRVFDYYFNKGDIAFDTAFSLADGVPSSAWLGGLSSRYGADKVVYLQVIWKQGESTEAVLDRVDYQIVGPRGAVLREGSLTADLVSPSTEEAKQTESVAARVLAGLSS